jgi:hypothetical protein
MWFVTYHPTRRHAVSNINELTLDDISSIDALKMAERVDVLDSDGHLRTLRDGPVPERREDNRLVSLVQQLGMMKGHLTSFNPKITKLIDEAWKVLSDINMEPVCAQCGCILFTGKCTRKGCIHYKKVPPMRSGFGGR